MKWWPYDYIDEIMGTHRASANAWIEDKDGRPFLGANDIASGFGEEPRAISDGEIVKFVTMTDHGEAIVTLNDAGSWSVSSSMPEAAESCCILYGWQSDTVGGNVDETMKALIAEGAKPGEYTISFYTYSNEIPLRFDQATRSFTEPGTTQ